MNKKDILIKNLEENAAVYNLPMTCIQVLSEHNIYLIRTICMLASVSDYVKEAHIALYTNNQISLQEITSKVVQHLKGQKSLTLFD